MAAGHQTQMEMKGTDLCLYDDGNPVLRWRIFTDLREGLESLEEVPRELADRYLHEAMHAITELLTIYCFHLLPDESTVKFARQITLTLNVERIGSDDFQINGFPHARISIDS